MQIYFNIIKQETKIAHQCRPRRPSLPPPTSTCGPAYQPVAPPSSVAILGTTRPRTTLQVPTGPTCQLQSRLVCFNLTLIITCKSNIEKLFWTSSRLCLSQVSLYLAQNQSLLPISPGTDENYLHQTCVLQPDVDHHMQE